MKAFPLPRPTTDADRDALGSQNQSLNSGEAFQFCLDAIPGAVFQMATSLEGLVVDYPYIGAGCYKLLELSQSAAASPRLLDTIHADDSAQFELALARAVRSLHLWSWEGRILLANGKIKWISLKVQPVSSQSIKCQTK